MSDQVTSDMMNAGADAMREGMAMLNSGRSYQSVCVKIYEAMQEASPLLPQQGGEQTCAAINPPVFPHRPDMDFPSDEALWQHACLTGWRAAVLPQVGEAKPELSKTEREEKITFLAQNLPQLARNANACMTAFGSDYVESLASEALSFLYEYDGVLRGLAFYLSAGGYNSDGLILPEVADDKIRWGIKDLAAPASLGEAKAVADQLYEIIESVLKSHRLQHIENGEGGGFPLVDQLSSGHTIETGLEEITLICDSIYNEILAAPVAEALPLAAENSDAEKVLAYLDTGEWSLVRVPRWGALTDEANDRCAWSVARQQAPYCTNKGIRHWNGNTALAAFESAVADLQGEKA